MSPSRRRPRRSAHRGLLVPLVVALTLGTGGCTADNADPPGPDGTAASSPTASSSVSSTTDAVRNPTPADEYAAWAGVDACALLRQAGRQSGAVLSSVEPDRRGSMGPSCTAEEVEVGEVGVSVLAPYRAGDLAGAGWTRVTAGSAAGWRSPPAPTGCQVLLPTSMARGVVFEAATAGQSPGCTAVEDLAEAVASIVATDLAAVRRTDGPPLACDLLAAATTADPSSGAGDFCRGEAGRQLRIVEDEAPASGGDITEESTRTIAGTSVSLRRLSSTAQLRQEGRRCAGVWTVPAPTGSPRDIWLVGRSCADVAALARGIIPASLRPYSPPADLAAPFYRDDEPVPGE